MTRMPWTLGLVASLLAGCGLVGAPVGAPAPTDVRAAGVKTASYRVFQGFRRADLSAEAFQSELNGRFLSGGPCTLAKRGVTAYLAARSPQLNPLPLPDTFALMAVDSEAAYNSVGTSEEGKRFLAVQWSLFDVSQSTNLQTTGLDKTGGQLIPMHAYDLMGQAVDWQEGFTTFHLGLRAPATPSDKFLSEATALFVKAKPTLASRGLDGFVTLSCADYVVSFMHWKDFWSYTGAMASREGRAFMAERDSKLTDHMFVNTVDFAGKLKPGGAVNVRFNR